VAQVTTDAGGGVAEDDIEWLSTKEAARHLGIATATLYRLIDAGELPAYRFGRVIRLQQAEVDAFIEASRIRPGTLDALDDVEVDAPEGR
jgi:excisionase family DNA binding protein